MSMPLIIAVVAPRVPTYVKARNSLCQIASIWVGCSTTPTGGTAAAPTSAANSTVAATSATVTAAVPVQITNASLNASDATITVQDIGTQPVSLSGWTLMIGSTPVQLPPNATVPA